MSDLMNIGFILENEIFKRSHIEKRLIEGNFNVIARFEQFIWDLELFLQLQNRLKDNLILKGGAAAQFYIPVAKQRTSVDIDMICLASPYDVTNAISDIEEKLSDSEGNFKFKAHMPRNPRLHLSKLMTYYVRVPSICNENELKTLKGFQEVKCEFIFSSNGYPFNKIINPGLFALETKCEFNVLALEYLIADKLTTLGPNTIGIPDDRIDEQFKQLYDLISLISTNFNALISKKNSIHEHYIRAAMEECEIHNIQYNFDYLFSDMKLMINRIKRIESDTQLLKEANDFQSVYLRKEVNRNKSEWAIVGYQLDLFIEFIFRSDERFINFRKFETLIEKYSFLDLRGPERGLEVKKVRDTLKLNFAELEDISTDIFNKRFDRIIWELASIVPYDKIKNILTNIT